MTEKIVFVRQDGTPTGEVGDKLSSHHADTRLHLAFSCYVFDDNGRFLVTRRADGKRVWPGVWTSSVCGHPAPGEDIVAAIRRRLREELNMMATDFALVLPTYSYKTPPYNGIVEHEFCPVYAARATSSVRPNPNEVGDYQWLNWEAYVREVEADKGHHYSWWSKDQLKRLQEHPIIKQYSLPIRKDQSSAKNA